MRKIVCSLILCSAASGVPAQETETVTVTGDRVSLRAGPAVTEVLLDRAMRGDELVLKDNSNTEWVGVVPPATVDLWVHSEYIRDGFVETEKLNVRSGPSLSHRVVGVLTNGQPVILRGETAEWVRIAPTPDTTVWISRQYADVASPEPEEPAPLSPPVEEAETTVAGIPDTGEPPVVAEASVSETGSDEADDAVRGQEPAPVEEAVVRFVPFNEAFRPAPEKEQGVVETFTGRLEPENEWLYRLAAADVPEITVCYVRGNSGQMKLFSGRLMRLTGKTYWMEQRDLPFIVPARIELIPPSSGL
jgi:uncharacterized protein YraI